MTNLSYFIISGYIYNGIHVVRFPETVPKAYETQRKKASPPGVETVVYADFIGPQVSNMPFKVNYIFMLKDYPNDSVINMNNDVSQPAALGLMTKDVKTKPKLNKNIRDTFFIIPPLKNVEKRCIRTPPLTIFTMMPRSDINIKQNSSSRLQPALLSNMRCLNPIKIYHPDSYLSNDNNGDNNEIDNANLGKDIKYNLSLISVDQLLPNSSSSFR